MKRLALLFFIVIYCGFLNAQELNYIQGEIIVKSTEKNLNRLLLNNSNYKFQLKKILSISNNLYLLSFDNKKNNEFQVLNFLQKSPFIEVAQLNHKISMRATTPTDTLFNNQWQYKNDGSFGGVIGADLDLDLAWDTTTGGTTILGDTIVICILDDGIDTNHLDFGSNIWVNHNEIPNNGMDDDGNGYIDDYKGWNITTQNDSIYGGSHGTPIAGSIGAKGNNTTGIAGINWNVKLMIVKNDFNTNEAAVIEAYEYPLKMRKLYNQTNGVKGAFVVATNSSWGIDYGNPINSPLWCAMYDSLGKYGVLSCGATTNTNTDCDVKGDLPTGCSSDYLISVTNLNNADVKVTNAGYGSIAIDLGAYGENVYTTQFSNGYGGSSGTSNATPMVTGTIGLLYALNCNKLMQMSKNEPEKAAILVKNAILSSVVLNSSLTGKVKTNGRLNIFNSIKHVLKNCDSSLCIAPYSLNASDLTDSSVVLNWESLKDTGYIVQFRNSKDTIWLEYSSTVNFITIDSLKPCQNYEFKVKSNCNSNYSSIFKFKSEGCEECASTNYCKSKASSSSLIWIDSVGFGELDYSSQNNNGYGEFLTLDANYLRGKKYLLSIKPGFSSTKYKAYYKTWIDFNQNLVFDSTELIYENLIEDSTMVSDSILIADSVPEGVTRMRVSMQIFSGTFQSCSSLSFGEVEDYCIGIWQEDTSKIDTGGIGILETNMEISFYPNPINDVLNIDLPENVLSEVSIFDIAGKVLLNEKYYQKNIVLNFSDKWNKGVYFVKIELPNTILVRKIIKN